MAGISLAPRSGWRSEMDCQIDSADCEGVDSDFAAYAMLVISIMPLMTQGQTERSREDAVPERSGGPAPVRASRAESSARRKTLHRYRFGKPFSMFDGGTTGHSPAQGREERTPWRYPKPEPEFWGPPERAEDERSDRHSAAGHQPKRHVHPHGIRLLPLFKENLY